MKRAHCFELRSRVRSVSWSFGSLRARPKRWSRKIDVYNPSGSSVAFTFSIGADAQATRIRDAYTVAANSALELWLYLTTEPSEIIQAFAATNNILTLTISGDENIPG